MQGTNKLIFVVSTGRCGSTMISDMVRLHPRWLSLSEFLVSLTNRAFTVKRPDGERFWRLLSEFSPTARRMLGKGYRLNELLYPFGPRARFQPHNVPPILCTTLPHLTEDCEMLYDELGAAVRGRAQAPLAEHYRFLFAWLCRRLDKQAAIERSGASLLLVPTLAQFFPEARFVHVHRDGRDTALSMQGHHYFRLIAQFSTLLQLVGINPFRPPMIYGTSRWYGPLEMLAFRLYPLERYLDAHVSAERLGSFWSDMVVAGHGFLAALPAERAMTLRYEDVVRRPSDELRRLAGFVGPEFVDEDWIERASRVPEERPAAWHGLPPAERARLEAACAPGLALLGYR